jgi:hypothetical protein
MLALPKSRVNSTLPVLAEPSPIFSCAKSGEKRGSARGLFGTLMSSFETFEQKVKSNSPEGLFIFPSIISKIQSAAAIAAC